MSLLYVLMLAQAVPVAAPAASEPSEVSVAHMTPREIKAYNQALPHNSPYYIRCVRDVPVGSLIATVTTCRTNARWRALQDAGNEQARRNFEPMQGAGFTSGH